MRVKGRKFNYLKQIFFKVKESTFLFPTVLQFIKFYDPYVNLYNWGAGHIFVLGLDPLMQT